MSTLVEIGKEALGVKHFKSADELAEWLNAVGASKEFIELCKTNFKLGGWVEFQVIFVVQKGERGGKMSKHTPGPWMIQEPTTPDGTLFIGTDLKGFFSCARASGVSTENIRANARLIAAAPELLEALKGLHRWMHDNVGFEKCESIDELACIAIAKAEGEEK